MKTRVAEYIPLYQEGKSFPKSFPSRLLLLFHWPGLSLFHWPELNHSHDSPQMTTWRLTKEKGEFVHGMNQLINICSREDCFCLFFFFQITSTSTTSIIQENRSIQKTWKRNKSENNKTKTNVFSHRIGIVNVSIFMCSYVFFQSVLSLFLSLSIPPSFLPSCHLLIHPLAD